MANTILYGEEWATKLQERLDHTTVWKEVANVIYTDTKVLNVPYASAYPAASALTRGTAYTHTSITEVADTLDINTSWVVPMFIDRADLAQSDFTNQMFLADTQGQILNEKIEALMLANYASWTTFDNASIGGSAGNITVSASNIDDIIRGIKREIREANGTNMMDRKGVFIIWRPADFEILEAFMQANGFMTADSYLKNGSVSGLRYMGVDHYVSNDHTAGHLMAGVKGIFTIGLLKATYGQIVIDQEPALNGSGAASGIGVITRIDYGFNVPTAHVGLVFNVAVA
jgi:hypothetical protein